MHSKHDKRMRVLESYVTVAQRRTLPGLIALCESGKLDMPELTDQELWWLIVGKEEPLPDEAEQERRLAAIHESD